MNRTIKFRGKRIDNGEWCYGYFGKDYSGNCIISNYLNAPNEAWKVIPETVGQFTGLLDKNGKEIYEGDIVSVKDFTNVSSSYIGKVIFRGGQWCVEYYKEYRCCPPLFFDDFADKKTEVIGNIHDNPELLEGGEP